MNTLKSEEQIQFDNQKQQKEVTYSQKKPLSYKKLLEGINEKEASKYYFPKDQQSYSDEFEGFSSVSDDSFHDEQFNVNKGEEFIPPSEFIFTEKEAEPFIDMETRNNIINESAQQISNEMKNQTSNANIEGEELTDDSSGLSWSIKNETISTNQIEEEEFYMEEDGVVQFQEEETLILQENQEEDSFEEDLKVLGYKPITEIEKEEKTIQEAEIDEEEVIAELESEEESSIIQKQFKNEFIGQFHTQIGTKEKIERGKINEFSVSVPNTSRRPFPLKWVFVRLKQCHFYENLYNVDQAKFKSAPYYRTFKRSLYNVHNSYLKSFPSKPVPQPYSPKKLVEKKLEPPNIGFVQFWISGSESELEFYFHDANHSTGEISFETFENEFGEKKANFSSRVQQLFWPLDFNQFKSRIYYSSQFKRSAFSSFMAPDYELKSVRDSYLRCLERSVSNLVGGIAFYSGSMERVDGRKDEEKDVFSATPSRQIFPRGFLWDEGYHQIALCHWDIDLCKDILSNWLDLIDEDGWIAREQVRVQISPKPGSRRRNQVPYPSPIRFPGPKRSKPPDFAIANPENREPSPEELTVHAGSRKTKAQSNIIEGPQPDKIIGGKHDS